MRINILTARPALEYMLAAAGFESPLVPVQEGWDTFRAFMEEAADPGEDSGGFQTSWERENPNAPVLTVAFVRQLTDQPPGYGEHTRLVALEFLFEGAPAELTEREVWSHEYSSLDEFFAYVEGLREFRFAVATTPSVGQVISEEGE